MRSTVPARRLIRSTRAPPKPWVANSARAASRMRRCMPAGSRLAPAARGLRTPARAGAARMAMCVAALALQMLQLVFHFLPLIGIGQRLLLRRDRGEGLGELGVERREAVLVHRQVDVGVD